MNIYNLHFHSRASYLNILNFSAIPRKLPHPFEAFGTGFVLLFVLEMTGIWMDSIGGSGNCCINLFISIKTISLITTEFLSDPRSIDDWKSVEFKDLDFLFISSCCWSVLVSSERFLFWEFSDITSFQWSATRTDKTPHKSTRPEPSPQAQKWPPI